MKKSRIPTFAMQGKTFRVILYCLEAKIPAADSCRHAISVS